MGKGNDGGWGWVIALFAVGVIIYVQTGRDEENAALIPDSLENQIDREVKALNDRFGKKWIDRWLEVLAFYAQRALPQPVPTLLNVLFTVEKMSKDRYMTGTEKQQAAVQMMRRV